ncbi:hypothetical protein ACET3Z_030671 [Daucus carota]
MLNILLNCDEIDEYVRLYDAELKVKHPNISDKDIQVNRYNGFSLWIKDKMASEATPQTKSFIGRGPNCIPKAPMNPDDRTMIHIRPFPHDNDFADPKIVKCISQLCLQNWPTPVIRWAETPLAHKDAVWAEFQVPSRQ